MTTCQDIIGEYIIPDQKVIKNNTVSVEKSFNTKWVMAYLRLCFNGHQHHVILRRVGASSYVELFDSYDAWHNKNSRLVLEPTMYRWLVMTAPERLLHSNITTDIISVPLTHFNGWDGELLCTIYPFV
jgi:hypothetical protein